MPEFVLTDRPNRRRALEAMGRAAPTTFCPGDGGDQFDSLSRALGPAPVRAQGSRPSSGPNNAATVIASSVAEACRAAVPYASQGAVIETECEIAHQDVDGSRTLARIKLRYGRDG